MVQDKINTSLQWYRIKLTFSRNGMDKINL